MKMKLVILSILATIMLNSCNNTTTQEQTNFEDTNVESGLGDNTEPETDYLAVGKDIVSATQSVLAKNLMDAINKGGAEYALVFCNTKAIPLTDSMVHTLNAGIKRVSDKPRNTGNQANEIELAYIRELKDGMARGEQPKPKMNEIDGKMVGFYPIVTNQMCLQCHGKANENIKASTLQKLNKLYPTDKARDYEDNQLRGLWIVEMNKK